MRFLILLDADADRGAAPGAQVREEWLRAGARLDAGHAILDAGSKDEALEWARRVAACPGGSRMV